MTEPKAFVISTSTAIVPYHVCRRRNSTMPSGSGIDDWPSGTSFGRTPSTAALRSYVRSTWTSIVLSSVPAKNLPGHACLPARSGQ
jgi:hypothetical protein